MTDQISWTQYAQYPHVEIVRWIHLQNFEPYFQILFRNWSISVWLEKSCPVFKKSDKRLLNNYRPISLLPIIGKILERLLYDQMFEFLIRNHLIFQNKSVFKPGNSCINQLWATRDLQIFWCLSWHKSCVFRYLKSIRQSLAPVSSLQIETERYFG